MKQQIIYFSIALTFVLASCENTTETQSEKTTSPKTPVEIVSVSNGTINDELTLFGTTIYLKRNLVTAPIPAFITQVNVKLGDKVSKGDLLYVIQSKESRALGNDAIKIDSTLKNFGILKIAASASGIISTLDKQQSGDYVLEGTQLCTISESKDLVFQVNVPYKYSTYAKTGNKCTIVLPDNTMLEAKFTKALTTMNVAAQTQIILAKSNKNTFLPENMVVKVNLSKGRQTTHQIAPKSSVLTDEMMTKFWVMKLMNDTTAIKVPVTIGNKNSESIEILSPQFTSTDRIISKGNYGLSDTAFVSIVIPETK